MFEGTSVSEEMNFKAEEMNFKTEERNFKTEEMSCKTEEINFKTEEMNFKTQKRSIRFFFYIKQEPSFNEKKVSHFTIPLIVCKIFKGVRE